ncbi:unnamed protein product [Owenia fusiformis]|uniref:Iron-sulfur cluster assembly 2 homolog, mitochondrial n=1 Tax=Owenia fusiformis TaxID=6347 RepID=A0A8J1U0W7_OWEFU|nr:unnamed protein product [Owenia fusiformis]
MNKLLWLKEQNNFYEMASSSSRFRLLLFQNSTYWNRNVLAACRTCQMTVRSFASTQTSPKEAPTPPTPAEVTTAKSTVQISDSCIKRMKKIGAEQLRILVEGGGCSGFQYKFEVDKTVNEDDRVFEREGVKIIVDEDSVEYLNGSTVDYHEELIKSAFRVIDNPNAEQGCSCGASFSVKF